jgi:hypothetical protein
MAQQILSTNTFTTAKWIVSATASDGTHTTIATALTSASSGDTIFIRPGTYTENPTLKAGVNLTAFGSDSSLNQTGKVIISGKCTMTTAGTVTISGIQLQTNSDFCLAVTGSAASIVNLQNCNINCTNNTGISYSSSSGSSAVNIFSCTGDLGTTGIAIYSMSGAGLFSIMNSNFTNTGTSTTASSNSAGTVDIYFSNFTSPFSTSSGGVIGVFRCIIDSSAQNATALTTAGTGASSCYASSLGSGSASAVSIGAGTSLNLYQCIIGSSNTNAVTGAGTIRYSGLLFTSTSQTINVTTQTIAGTIPGSTTTAPTAGMLGEQISSSVTSVATTTGNAKSITSITLTAGVWDISCITTAVGTGGTLIITTHLCNISTTDNTVTGTLGQDQFQFNGTFSVTSGCVPVKRVTITTNTTYYLVVFNIYTSTTCPTNGRISATRVG